MHSLIAAILLGVASLMGVQDPTAIPVPEVQVITEQKAEEMTKMPIRGLYEDGVVYLVDMDGNPAFLTEEELVTLAHELAHVVQDAEGKLPELQALEGTEKCDIYFNIEMEALDIEDKYRKVLGLEKANRMAYYIMRAICLNPEP